MSTPLQCRASEAVRICVRGQKKISNDGWYCTVYNKKQENTFCDELVAFLFSLGFSGN